jgi:hypothetical protein
MDIPRGHAMLPLNESDFLDFIYNYFKAEYAPINSFWSTATAIPRQEMRWINMGHELAPSSIRPANAQAQKDLESLDYFVRKWNLDAGFVRGVVKRFASYEVHERLEKKLYECARLDLMVRKALKEKHLLDALWPSPAPRDLAQELLAQGVQVRRWYGDMFAKYFRALHSVDEFELRPEVDHYIKSRGTLMLMPFVDHLVFGVVEPIVPIVSKGAGFANARPSRRSRTVGFGDAERFEVRFDSPTTVTETYTKSTVRQCQCMKCGTKRDVQIVVSVDPSPYSDTSATDSRQSNARSTQRQATSESEAAPPHPPRPQLHNTARPSTPEQKKQCSACTFLNHPDLTTCEMCQAELPTTTVTKPLSPAPARASHSHSSSLPSISTSTDTPPASTNTAARPAAPNRHSLSSTLFAIFPFSQQHQQEHHAKLPATQQTSTTVASGERSQPQESASASASGPTAKHESVSRDDAPQEQQASASVPASQPQPNSSSSPLTHQAPQSTTPPLSRAPEMAMMPLTPPNRTAPLGLPKSLMDDYVPVSPVPQSHDDEDAGWGEVSRAEATKDEDEDEDEDGDGADGALVDLDAVAREEMGVWGERED